MNNASSLALNNIKTTDTFFIISNFNTDPEFYLQYCENYHIYDQSTNLEIREALSIKYRDISFVQNTGHNISDYFRFFAEHYDKLPSWMMLLKGNMVGRHITLEYFNHVYSQKNYTPLYSDRNCEDSTGIAYQLYDGAYLEVNNSWYATTKVYRYFDNFNELLRFVFKDPIISRWVLFSPGACYIVGRNQVTRYPAQLYQNLNQLLSYTYFPSEAYMIERMLHIIFSSSYELNEWMIDNDSFNIRLAEQENKLRVSQSINKNKLKILCDKWHHLVLKTKHKLMQDS